MLAGAKKRLEAEGIDRLRAAWHTVAWYCSAKGGEFKGWAHYYREFAGVSDKPVSKDWRTRKAERQAQMEQLTKRQQQRSRPPRRRT